MKIVSEKTNKEYATVEECLAAEKAYDEKVAAKKAEEEKALVAKKEAKEKALAERKAAAAIVEDKRKALAEAQKAYREELSKFCDKYGAYHYTVKGGDDSIFDLFNRFFDDLWF